MTWRIPPRGIGENRVMRAPAGDEQDRSNDGELRLRERQLGQRNNDSCVSDNAFHHLNSRIVGKAYLYVAVNFVKHIIWLSGSYIYIHTHYVICTFYLFLYISAWNCTFCFKKNPTWFFFAGEFLNFWFCKKKLIWAKANRHILVSRTARVSAIILKL